MQKVGIPKGTSITKAVESLLGKKDELIKTLREKESLMIYDMVVHNILSMVTQTALDNGADI